MAGKGMSVGRAHGNGIGATHAPGINMAGGVASEFDRSMNKASYVDDTPVPVIVMDCEHNIEYVNRAASLMAGVAQEACVGMKMWDLFEMEACRKGNCVASHAMREGRAQAEDAECIVKGRRLLIRAHATPRYDEHNKIIGVVEVILDETVKKNDLAVLVEFGKGNFEAEAEEVDGKKAVINEHIERLRTNVKDFIEEMQHMAEEHKAGNSGVVIPEDKFEGCYRALAKSVNDIIMGHIKVNVKTLACMKQFGEGNFEAELERFAGKGAVINETIEQVRKNLKAFIAEMEHMSEAHKTGDIDVVIPEEKFEGSYRAMAKGVNDMVMGHISVKKKAMACVAEFGKGNFEAELEKFPGKKAFINENIERLRSSVKAFIENMKIMSEAHKAGDIDVVIPEEKFEGSYRAMAKGVNDMVMGHISVKKKAMACVAEFGKGNFEAELEKFPGKKAFINENIERLRSSVKAFIEDMKIMSDGHNAGDIDMVIPEDKFEGSYRVMAKGVNDMVMGHISVKKKAMACLKQFGEGNFEAELEKFPGKKAFINDTMEQVRKNLKALIDDTDLLVDAASEEGRLDVRADATKHQGDFRRIIEGLNKSFDTIAVPFTRAIMHIEKLSHGINGAQITVEGKGEILRQRDALNRLFVSIDKLIADSTMLAAAGAAGKLDTRADATKHEGDFRKIVEGVNSTLDAVVGPMQDVSATLTKLAGGDFTALVASKYAGDYEHLTNAVNTLSKSVRSALEQIGRNVAALASSAEELNKVSQSMGANADETATQAGVVSAASEQVSSNVQTVATGADEMGASIKEIAKNTAEATRVASAAVRTAEVTNETIAKLGQSSAEVGQVIKVITSIAQQTNLLALNATIEAARAGEAGKGFAVVANEVKELAKETAKATEDISRKIEAIQGDTNGAVSAISQISQVIGQISGIQTTIASAIEEQSATTNEIGRNLAEAAKGSTDISRNIGGVADAARATTIGATDTSKAAHSLEKMAAELQTLVGQFRY